MTPKPATPSPQSGAVQAVPWYRSLACKFFLRTALIILALAGSVLWVARDQSMRQAKESAQAGIRVSAQIMERSFANQARVMDAELEVFALTQANLTDIQNEDFSSIRDHLLEDLANLRADVAIVIRPSGALLSCTTDGSKQDYTDVGIVTLAMNPEQARAAGQPGPSYRGYFRIQEGDYRGVYHGVARRLQARDGAFLGVMLVATRLTDATATQLREQSTVLLKPGDPTAHVALVSGMEILGTTFKDAADRRAVAGWVAGAAGEQAFQVLRQQPTTRPMAVRIEGQEQLGMLASLSGANAGDLRLAKLITVPLEPFLRPFQVIQRAVLWVSLAAMAAGLLLALSAARSVTAPLARLTRAMATLADGKRPELVVSSSRDEVGALSKGFGILLSELKGKEELLQALEHLRAVAGSGASGAASHATLVDRDDTILLAESSNAPTGGGATAAASPLVLRKGDSFAGRYRIDRVLGSGGMGVVLKAHDETLDEDVALKVIRPELGGNALYLDQLKQEIKLARRISHRYVLRTHDFGEAGGIPFVSMEYLRGVTLRQLLDDRSVLPFALVLRIGRQVAEGLAAAHEQGVVHRDIKPQNILFDPRGDVKLMDFGLAAPLEGRGVVADGQIFGTPRYMAPEQVRGEPVDPRADLYSLGVMLFELACGFAPFEAPDITSLLRMHLEAEPPDVRSLNRDLPASFNRLLQRLLAKTKQQRPASAALVMAELASLQGLEAAGG